MGDGCAVAVALTLIGGACIGARAAHDAIALGWLPERAGRWGADGDPASRRRVARGGRHAESH